MPGIKTFSMTWITPLSALMSAMITLAAEPERSAIMTLPPREVMHRRCTVSSGLK